MSREGKRCVIYLRVSTEMQIDGFSLDGQRNTLTRYADREGMIVKGVYEDAGKSGKSIQGRPAFTKMLDDIKNGLEIDYILVYKLSRFGRNAADTLNSIEYIQSYDINLIATEEGIDSSQASGKLMISIISAMAEMERENILEQTMNGRREKARQGGWNGGFAPYGYEFENGKFYIIEEEAEIVKEIFDLFVNQKVAYNKIAHHLNLLGKNRALKKNRSLTNWSKAAIYNIIKNPIYKGTIAFGRRKTVKVKGSRNEYTRINTSDYIEGQGQHEAIVSEEIWNKAQEIAKERSRTGANPAYARTYLLSGLIRCPVCGGKMSSAINKWTTTDGKSYQSSYYRCRNAWEETGHKCDNRTRFDMGKLDNFIIEFVKSKITNGEFASYTKESFANEIDSSLLEGEKKKLKAKLAEVISNKQSLENKIDYMPLTERNREQKLEDYNARLDDLYDLIEEINKSIKDVDKKIAGINNSAKSIEYIMDILNKFETLFNKMTEVEKRKIITFLISAIYVNPETNMVDSIDFKMDLNNINNTDESISFNMKVDDENNVAAVNFREKMFERTKEFLPDYVKPKPKKKVVKPKVTYEVIDGVEVEIHNYEKSRRIVKERPKHYNRQQPTYQQIKDYIMEKYNVKIHTVYIAEVKRKHGIDMQANRRKTDPRCNCPKDKVAMIEDALRYFNILTESQA